MSILAHNLFHESRVPSELLFTVDKARNTSNNSGWAWSLTQNNKRVLYGAEMFGYPASKLYDALENPKIGPDTLYLSVPLHNDIAGLGELLPRLQKTKVRTLNIPMIDRSWWVFGDQKLLDDQRVVINRYPIDLIGRHLYYGPYTLLNKKRPWITCITACNMEGKNINLDQFKKEFGYTLQIQRKIQGSHAVVTDTDNKGFVEPGCVNAVGGEVAYHQYVDIAGLRQFLSHQAQLELSTTTVIVNYDICRELLSSGLVDELFVTYQLVNSSTVQSSISQHFSLEGWDIVDSQTLSQGVKVEMINRPF